MITKEQYIEALIIIDQYHHQTDIKEEASTKPLRLIRDLNVSIRAIKCCDAFKIKYVEELIQHTRKDLASMRGFGKKAIEELIEALADEGLSLRK